jgi:hypothetical protein
MKKRTSFAAMVVAISVTSCVWVTPQTPGNSAIHVLVALQVGDVEEIETLMCEAIAGPVDLDDPSTLGPLEPIFGVANERSGFGGASEYSPQESSDIPVDTSWTEVDFVGASETDRDVWRFHMVREGGIWKVCSVEHQPDAPLPPADIGSVDLAAVRNLASFDADTPADVRFALLQKSSASDANSRCTIEGGGPQSAWSVVATGMWPEQQPNGSYLIAYIEATEDLSAWRAYTLFDCEVRVLYP